MPHVYRPAYTRAIPPHAEKCRHQGRPAVRWRGRGGRVQVGIVCERNPKRCRVEASVWHLVYTGPDGRERDEAGYTDRAATEALLAERVKTAARVHAGLLPPEASVSRVSLPELLDEWGRHLRDSGCTAKHSRDRPLMVGRVVEAAGAVRPADLTPAKVVRAARVVREALVLSPLTTGYHLSACKQFTRWLAVTRRSETVDHLSGLRCELDQTAPTFTRRALAPAEFDTFVTATRKSKAVIRGLTGRERAALYLTAASTGLRASELAALTPAQFDLGASTVTARAAYAKGRRLDVLPLTADVVAELKPIIKATKPGEFVWPNRERSKWAAWHLEAAEMVAADLAAAGIPVKDAAGAVYDLHALRVQYGTDLDRAGVSLASAQRLMRHSTPKLTSKTYTKRSTSELAGEVAKLGVLRAKKPAK